MNDLPTRERIQDWLTLIEADGGHPDAHGEWTVAMAYTDGILQTRQEFINSLDATSMFMCWSIPAKCWMMRGHSAMNGCNSRCREVLIVDAFAEEADDG